MRPEEIPEFVGEHGIEVIDLKFTDLLGTWQHFSMAPGELKESTFTEGVGFDGSSIRLFQGIERSDMILIPDATTAIIDPATRRPTLSIVCDIADPVTGEPYHKDPRGLARRAEEYLCSTGIADISYWGPECEFFVFDDVRYESARNTAFYAIDSVEGIWNTGKVEGPNLAYKTDHKSGYFPTAPRDTLQDVRTEMLVELQRAGVDVEIHHHEVATAGQCEIDIRFDSLRSVADKVMMYKYIVRNVARRHGKTATFMPKPIFEDNGTGMHTHQSLWKDGSNLFYDADGYAMLSGMAKHYIGGLVKHAPAIMAFAAPTTNSYKRLVPGFEAPTALVYSARNRSAGIRIPMYSSSPAARRIEFRPPDPTANPYLAFSAMLMAGLDGIQRQLDPGEAIEDLDVYEMDLLERGVPQVPASLDEALRGLEDDCDFLCQGNVFNEDLIRTWVDWKRRQEIDEVRTRPHPHEFHMYFDA